VFFLFIVTCFEFLQMKNLPFFKEELNLDYFIKIIIFILYMILETVVVHMLDQNYLYTYKNPNVIRTLIFYYLCKKLAENVAKKLIINVMMNTEDDLLCLNFLYCFIRKMSQFEDNH
jgi:hypothetical protein